MAKALLIILSFFILCSSPILAQNIDAGDEYSEERRALANEIISGNDELTKNIREAFLSTRRELYVDENYQSLVFRDVPLPGGGGLIQPSPSMIISILQESSITENSRILIIEGIPPILMISFQN